MNAGAIARRSRVRIGRGEGPDERPVSPEVF